MEIMLSFVFKLQLLYSILEHIIPSNMCWVQSNKYARVCFPNRKIVNIAWIWDKQRITFHIYHWEMAYNDLITGNIVQVYILHNKLCV